MTAKYVTSDTLVEFDLNELLGNFSNCVMTSTDNVQLEFIIICLASKCFHLYCATESWPSS